MAEGNGFGYQLADDKREVGDDYYCGNHCQIAGIGFCSRYEREERNKIVCDGNPTIGTGYDTDKSNTDLDGGEEFFGFFQLFQYSFGSFVPFSDKSFKACFTWGD